MRCSFLLGAAAIALAPMAAEAATTITFAGVPTGVHTAVFREGGFDLAFDNFYFIGGEGAQPTCCNSAGSLTITRTGGGSFTFTSVDGSKSYFPDTGPASLTVRGFRGAASAFTQTFTLSSFGLQTFASSFGGAVDRLVFTGQRDLDTGANFTNVTLTSAIPEPQTWAMLIAGFGLVGAAMRRRRVAAFA